jgi:hypothetical protein
MKRINHQEAYSFDGACKDNRGISNGGQMSRVAAPETKRDTGHWQQHFGGRLAGTLLLQIPAANGDLAILAQKAWQDYTSSQENDLTRSERDYWQGVMWLTGLDIVQLVDEYKRSTQPLFAAIRFLQNCQITILVFHSRIVNCGGNIKEPLTIALQKSYWWALNSTQRTSTNVIHKANSQKGGKR